MEPRSITGQSYVLTTSAVAVHGEFACIVPATGKASPASVTAGLLCVGVFDLSATGGASVTGDGTKTVRISFPMESDTFPAKSDVTDPVTLVGSTCYLFDGKTVSSDSSGTSAAGTVVKIDASTTPDTIYVKVTGF